MKNALYGLSSPFPSLSSLSSASQADLQAERRDAGGDDAVTWKHEKATDEEVEVRVN
jgi:hypothetical protein